MLGRIELCLPAVFLRKTGECPKGGASSPLSLRSCGGKRVPGLQGAVIARKVVLFSYLLEPGHEPGQGLSFVIVPWADGRWLVSTMGVLCGSFHTEDPGVGLTWVSLGL